MVGVRLKAIAWAFLLTATLLLNASQTSADLSAERRVSGNRFSATTLMLSAQSSLNNKPLSVLFKSAGIIPEGLDVFPLRIRNTGKTDTPYFISFKKINGDDRLCDALDMQILHNSDFQSPTRLLSTTWQSPLLASGKKDDLIFFMYLDQRSEDLKDKSCSFILEVATKKNIGTSEKGFYSKRIVDNIITSGVW